MGDLIYLFIAICIIALVAWFTFYTDKQAAKTRAKRAEQERIEREEREEKKRQEEEALLQKAHRLAALGQVVVQSEIMGDKETHEKACDMTYEGKIPELRGDGAWTSIYDDLRIFKIVGMKYRGNLKPYIGRFNGILVPEPKNEYDPFAIMVKCEDGKHLGYIKEEQTNTVRWFIGSEQPLGEETPTVFKPYRVVGFVEEKTDDDENKYYDGEVYVKKG